MCRVVSLEWPSPFVPVGPWELDDLIHADVDFSVRLDDCVAIVDVAFGFSMSHSPFVLFFSPHQLSSRSDLSLLNIKHC